jgi:signal transduction histidine kinase
MLGKQGDAHDKPAADSIIWALRWLAWSARKGGSRSESGIAPESSTRLRDTRVANTADFDQIIGDHATYISRDEVLRTNELLAIIDEATDRLNLLAGEAVEKARLDTGGRLNLEPHAISEIIDAAREDCKALLGAHSIQVQVPLGVPAVYADLRLIKKALQHLLENASKYSPPDEPITVSVEMNGDFVITSVIDRAMVSIITNNNWFLMNCTAGRTSATWLQEREWDCQLRRLSLKRTAARWV